MLPLLFVLLCQLAASGIVLYIKEDITINAVTGGVADASPLSQDRAALHQAKQQKTVPLGRVHPDCISQLLTAYRDFHNFDRFAERSREVASDERIIGENEQTLVKEFPVCQDVVTFLTKVSDYGQVTSVKLKQIQSPKPMLELYVKREGTWWTGTYARMQFVIEDLEDMLIGIKNTMLTELKSRQAGWCQEIRAGIDALQQSLQERQGVLSQHWTDIPDFATLFMERVKPILEELAQQVDSKAFDSFPLDDILQPLTTPVNGKVKEINDYINEKDITDEEKSARKSEKAPLSDALAEIKKAMGPIQNLLSEAQRTRRATEELQQLQKAPLRSRQFQQNMDATHFYIPRELNGVFKKFLDYKTNEQNADTVPAAERTYYKETFKGDVDKFIASLIHKRTRAFMNKNDLTLLRDDGAILFLPWQKIGQDEWENAQTREDRPKQFNAWMAKTKYDETQLGQKYNMKKNAKNFAFEKFSIKNYLSYDEMQLAALMIVAGPSNFYSNCFLKYNAPFGKRIYDKGEFEEKGYIVGAVGPRFDKPGFMDFATLVPSNDIRHDKLREIIYGLATLPNPEEKPDDYIQMDWWHFFLDRYISKQEDKLEQDEGYKAHEVYVTTSTSTKVRKGKPEGSPTLKVSIHKDLFKKRQQISFGAYLDFAHQTMLKKENLGKKAYVVVLPIGAGVWAINSFEQPAYAWPAIEELLKERTEYGATIGCLHFVAMDADEGEVNGIKITKGAISGPTGKIELKTEDGSVVDTVRFIVYPWDSNALPGNEFWLPAADRSWPPEIDGKRQGPTLITVLEMSGDPAAVCCSDIMYTQNWLYNKRLGKPGETKQFPLSHEPVTPTERRRLMDDEKEMPLPSAAWSVIRATPWIGFVVGFIAMFVSSVYMVWVHVSN